MAQARIPVILDTDIGDWIDDTFALHFLLNSPELELKLVVTCYGCTNVRAAVVANFLTVAGRTDVAVGVGIKTSENDNSICQKQWVENNNFKLSDYCGKVSEDGVSAIVDTVMSSKQDVVILSIGTLHNISEAISREPEILSRSIFVGQHGHFALDPKYTRFTGWNIQCGLKEALHVLNSSWKKNGDCSI